MHSAVALIALLGTVSAFAGKRQAQSSQTSPANAASSLLFAQTSGQAPGSDPKYLTESGDWHWTAGQNAQAQNLAASSSTGCRQIQANFPSGTNGPSSTAAQRAASVKKAYSDAWSYYYKYAYPSDELFIGDPDFGRNGSAWKLTCVDGLDTALVMGLTDIANIQLQTIYNIDFSVTPSEVSAFDATIRWIGGMLSAYDLITSNKVPDAKSYNTTYVKALLTQASRLADLISPRFDTPTGLPRFGVNFTTHKPEDGGFSAPNTTNTAIAGTNILEYHRLSDLTGNQTWRAQADKAESYLLNPKPTPKYPNIVGGSLSTDTGLFLDKAGGWGSGIDSFYEYLIKSYVYDPSQQYATTYKNFWTTAVESTQKYLTLHPYAKKFPTIAYITDLNNNGDPEYAQSDYTCFAGGNFLLGGAFLNRSDFIQLGLTITDSCHKQFNDTISGLNPINIAWFGPNGNASDSQYNGNSTTVAKMARSQYEQYGYFITNPLNTQLPEPIESMYYAWRITGDTKWADYQWNVFQSFDKDGRKEGQVAGPWSNVSQPLGGEFASGFFGYPVASYYFAEALKYFYLTFSDPSLVSLDEFQFNTEGHPIRIKGGKCS